MTAPRAAVTGWSPPLAREAAAWRAQRPDQKAGSARCALRWGPAREGAGDRKGRPQLSLGSAGKGPWEPLCALRPGATWSGRPWEAMGLWMGPAQPEHPAGAGGGGSRCLGVGMMRLKTTTVLSCLFLAFIRVNPQPRGGFQGYLCYISFGGGLPDLAPLCDPVDCCLLNCPRLAWLSSYQWGGPPARKVLSCQSNSILSLNL